MEVTLKSQLTKIMYNNAENEENLAILHIFHFQCSTCGISQANPKLALIGFVFLPAKNDILSYYVIFKELMKYYLSYHWLCFFKFA